MGFNYKKYPAYTSDPSAALAKLILFIENVNTNVFVADKNGDIIYANSSCADTYQCPMDELFDFNAYTMEEKGYIQSRPAVNEVLTTKRAVKRYLKTGKNVGMIISCEPIFDEKGDIEYAVATSYNEEEYLKLINQISSEKNKLESAVNYLNNVSSSNLYLKSKNPKMFYLYEQAEKAAKSDSVVMIYGQTGTGKEVMAHYIHSNSTRWNAPFIPINCAAIPSELMESELFGYEKGSFTGASSKGKLGLFDVASDGTIFLDEIGELPLSMQSKLLRVLESGEYMRIGSNKISKTNARIIGATNKELWKLVQEGKFREDLYFRLNIIPLYLPALKDRREDIIPLSKHFLSYFNQKFKTNKSFSDTTLEIFQSYKWIGNIRELRNTIERLVIISGSDVIDITNDFFTSGIYLQPHSPWQPQPDSVEAQNRRASDTIRDVNSKHTVNIHIDTDIPYKDAISQFEQEYVSRVLEQCGGNISKTAKRLHIQRSSLYNILARFKTRKVVDNEGVS